MTLYKEPFAKEQRGDLFGNLAPYRNGKPHRGMDWHPPAGTIIPAITDGKVTQVFWSDVLGNVVETFTNDGLYVQYAHLKDKPKSLKKGSVVKLGQSIGRVGNTGAASTGAHLHLQLAKVPNGHLATYDSLLDPLDHIRKNREPRNP